MFNIRSTDVTIMDLKAFFQNKRIFYLFMSLSFFLLIVEVAFTYVGDIIIVSNLWGFSLFLVLMGIFTMLEITILVFTGSIIKQIKNYFGKVGSIHTVAVFIQLVLSALIVGLLVEIAVSEKYHTSILLILNSLSWGFSIFIFGVIAKKFLDWYKYTNNFTILLFTFSSSIALIGGLVTAAFFGLLIIDNPMERNAESEVVFKEVKPGSVEDLLGNFYAIFNITYFLIFWTSIIPLIGYKANRIGRVKFIIFITLPLISYMGIFFIADPIANSLSNETNIIEVNIIGYLIPNMITGIVFAIPFWKVAKTFNATKRLRDYFTITGFGFAFFFIVSSSAVDHAPYPPIGIVSISLVGLSSYLIFLGLYSSAVSISTDALLRKVIKESVIKEMGLFRNLGEGEMYEKVQKNVNLVLKNQDSDLLEKTGIKSDLSYEEINNYISEVISEVLTQSNR